MSPDLPNPRARPLRMRLLRLAASGLLPLVMVLGWGLNYLVDERRIEAERSPPPSMRNCAPWSPCSIR